MASPLIRASNGMMVAKAVKSSKTLPFGAALLSLLMGTCAPSHAQSSDDWRKKLGKFRVGIVGGNRPILQRRQVQPFREVLQKALGLPVEVFAARDHQMLIDAMVGSRIEYATFSATAFSAAWQLCKCVEPVAVPLAKDGSSSFRSVLLSRYLGPGSLAALKNKTILVPGKHSFSGFLYPRAALIVKGLKLDTPEWPVDDLGTMRSAVSAFSEGKGDAILGWVPDLPVSRATPQRGTLYELAENADDGSKSFRVLWKSAPVPHGPHTIRRRLPKEIKQLVWQTLRDLNGKNPEAYDAIEPSFGGGFRQVTIGDFKPLSDVLSKLPKAIKTK